MAGTAKDSRRQSGSALDLFKQVHSASTDDQPEKCPEHEGNWAYKDDEAEIPTDSRTYARDTCVSVSEKSCDEDPTRDVKYP